MDSWTAVCSKVESGDTDSVGVRFGWLPATQVAWDAVRAATNQPPRRLFDQPHAPHRRSIGLIWASLDSSLDALSTDMGFVWTEAADDAVFPLIGSARTLPEVMGRTGQSETPRADFR